MDEWRHKGNQRREEQLVVVMCMSEWKGVVKWRNMSDSMCPIAKKI
jgi:hypothetical protein